MAYVSTIYCPEFHLIKDDNRPTDWVLDGGTASEFTDVNFSAYVPLGVKALLLKWYINWVGDGAKDYSMWQLRKNGSSVTTHVQLTVLRDYMTNLAAGIIRATEGQIVMECDSAGIVEYRFYNGGTAVGTLSLSIVGFWL